MADYSNRPIIIKKVKKVAHAHHGGAWKIAYADFVTAMMAFFLLLWLISMTTPEQKQGLADYFAPPNISASNSGSGGVMGGTAMDSAGAQMSGSVSTEAKADAPKPQDSVESGAANASSQSQAQADIKASQSRAFHSAAASIRQAWQAMPDITEIADNLLVEETPEGLNIQIVDQEGRPMFPEGSKFPFELTRKAIAAIAPILQQLPNQISISGHTAAGGVFSNPRYGPWDLSSDRANVVRSILSEFGLADDRIEAVTGRSTSDPFFPNDPYMAANQRVKITVLYDAPPVPPDMAF
ncbi:OmpA family protein [Devosia neptuniae]|uniref:OmpA family protein n=1 Tax=Devosia neptuniae TaxID=191302 RepID=A0ABY6CF18_9HYPH|nr:flagellar motor protein MotB [Devosia neptuniae]UXN70834.1 OmpA family protein [Devosia neptuniae]